MQKFDTRTFQGLILTLQDYWARQGCTIVQPLDMEVGAGTSHPMTCLRALGPEPMAAAYVQPSRRPTDGRYGENPNRLQHYYQFQVVIKPSPDNIQELYLGSLKELGMDPTIHDIRFVEDNWENPTLGAWGLGWEVWLNGMEVTQFTYFQQVGGLECKPVTGEITYGLERLAMYIQGVDSVYDLVWSDGPLGKTTYGDVFHQNEVEDAIKNYLEQNHIACKDFGTFDTESVDYVPIASKVAHGVANGEGEFGILCCGTGIGMSMAANKVQGVRAAVCSDPYCVEMTRRHNNANVLCMGGRVIDEQKAVEFVKIFLSTGFEGGRHQRRVDQIAAVERGEL